jgi:NADP-dependent 3-hydroxy acid dehydrogenase YdfG
MSEQSLQDKVVIIVGASSGMGKATAVSFHKAGAKLVIAARNEKALNDLASELGEDVIVFPADARDVDAIEKLIEKTVQSYGRIDTLIYATGTNIPDRSLEKLTHETWEMMLAVNATGAFNCTKAVLPVMQSQKDGLIIYISSVSAKRADVSGVSYQASKHALTGLAHGTYLEQKKNGIRTSLIMPGLCDTPLVQQRPVPPSETELKKALQPQDVADACLYVVAAPSRVRIGELVMEPAGL